MDAGRSRTRILIVPRPRTGPAPEQLDHRPGRTTIRAVRRVGPRSSQGVLARVTREIREPGWSPSSAGHVLAVEVRPDPSALRSARIQLLASALDPRSLSDAKALATIDVAIAEIEGCRRR